MEFCCSIWGKRSDLERINPYVSSPLGGLFLWRNWWAPLKTLFCDWEGSFVWYAFRNAPIHKVFRSFQNFWWNKISHPNHQSSVFRGTLVFNGWFMVQSAGSVKDAVPYGWRWSLKALERKMAAWRRRPNSQLVYHKQMSFVNGGMKKPTIICSLHNNKCVYLCNIPSWKVEKAVL